NSDLVGTDVSTDSLAYAVANAGELGLENVEFMLGSLFEPVLGRFDAIVCNPPYIRTVDIESLAPEIRDHEPRGALDGGEDGLNFYRRIMLDVPKHLRLNGMLFMELGAGQAEDVKGICEHVGMDVVTVISDLAGHGRILVARNSAPQY
ncbi:N5-glutamine methyltransferase family protein, partial [Nitrospirota bacterium]